MNYILVVKGHVFSFGGFSFGGGRSMVRTGEHKRAIAQERKAV